MARLDVHARRDNRAGYLLDVQADLLSGLNTRLVVPLLPRADAPAPAARLNPVVDIAGEPFVIVTQSLRPCMCANSASVSQRWPITTKQ
jgi:toxin CcdB